MYRDISPCKCYTYFNFNLNSFLQETQPWSISLPTEQTTWPFLQPHQQMLYTMVFEATTITAMTINGSFYRPRKRFVRIHVGISDCRRQNIWQRVNGQWRRDYVEQLQLPIHPRGLLVLYRGCANSPWTRGHCAHPGYFRKPSARGRMVKF